MLNKIIKNASALLLSLTLLLPVQMLGTIAQETDPKDKIGDILLGEMEYNENYLDVTVYFTKFDDSDLSQEGNSWSLNDFLSEVGLSEERVASISPLIILATNEEIYDMAASDKVTSISVTYYPALDYAYTAGDALKILQVAVGAEAVDTKQYMRISGGDNKVYDINQDGLITAGDAYIALRYSVGCIDECIGPSYIVNQRKARLLEKDALN